MTDKTLVPVRLYEQVAEIFRDEIVTGVRPVCSRLPTERELAALYGVSRNVVREAIRTLVKDGLVQVRQGSGTYVVDATATALGSSVELVLDIGSPAEKFRHLLEIRQLVEPGIAALAAERATDEAIELLRQQVAIMDEAQEDQERFILADRRFHTLIAQCTGNSLVQSLLDPVVHLLDEKRSKLFLVDQSAASAQEFHHRILAAIEHRDARLAYAYMRAHLEQVSTDISGLAASKNEIDEPARSRQRSHRA